MGLDLARYTTRALAALRRFTSRRRWHSPGRHRADPLTPADAVPPRIPRQWDGWDDRDEWDVPASMTTLLDNRAPRARPYTEQPERAGAHRRPL
jgi:hypothetical protein